MFRPRARNGSYTATFINIIILLTVIEECVATVDSKPLKPVVEMANEHLKTVGFKHSRKGCVMRGICGGMNETLKQNCAYDSYAVPTDVGTATELVDLCPNLFTEGKSHFIFSLLRWGVLNESNGWRNYTKRFVGIRKNKATKTPNIF